MIISSGTTYRSIAAQNILSYTINGNINNTTGVSSFGFSGDSGNLNLFTFKNGKIYDINNRHVWSYNPSENFLISGNINTGNHNYYINNNIVCLSSPKINSYYKYFYISSNNSTIDLDIYTCGNKKPEYYINFTSNNILGNKITGTIVNINSDPNLSIQFFTGDIIGQQYYSIENLFTNFISGQQSGRLVLDYTSSIDPNSFNSGSSVLDFLNGNFVFQTNFGEQFSTFKIPINNRPYYFLDFVEIFTGILNNNYNYIYQIQTKSDKIQNIEIILSRNDGYGNEKISTGFFSTGLFNNQLFGFIYGQNYVTGLFSGIVTSTGPDYYGNYISYPLTQTVKQLQSATGLINYNYRLPIPGGSGLYSGGISTIPVISSGYAIDITGNEFIYGSRSFITGAKIGRLTGYWYDFIQTGINLININSNQNIYFTGENTINYNNFFWNGIPYFGFDIINSNNDFKIYGITGSRNISFSSIGNGINTEKELIYTQQQTGILLSKLFKLSYDDIINNISGNVFASENVNTAINVFSYDSSSPWNTSYEVSTGFLDFEFKNFSGTDSGIISHYEIILNKNFSNYKFLPRNFKLQGSNNSLLWNDMDSETGVNFYHPDTNIFQVTGTGNYNYVRLLITSGTPLPHINKNIYDTYPFGLSIFKVNFYKLINSNISGIYDNLIDNNVAFNDFYGRLTNSSDLIYRSINTGSGFSGLIPFNEKAFTSINISLNNRITVATAKDSYVYISRNTGITWATGIDLKRQWTNSAISSDGRVITVTAYDDKIYTSRDSGINWTSFSGIDKWVSVDVSSDGRYQAALAEEGITPVLISQDSGISWALAKTGYFPSTDSPTWVDIKLSPQSLSKGRFRNMPFYSCTSDGGGGFDCYLVQNSFFEFVGFTGLPIFSCAICGNEGIYLNENIFETVTGLYYSGEITGASLEKCSNLGNYYKTTNNPPFPPPLSQNCRFSQESIWERANPVGVENWSSIGRISILNNFTKIFALSRGEISDPERKDVVYTNIDKEDWISLYTGTNIYKYYASFPSGAIQSIISDSGIFTSRNTGIVWGKETGNLNKLWASNLVSYYKTPLNGPGLAISSGGNIIFATNEREKDLLFSNQPNLLDLWKITFLNKDIFPNEPPFVELTGDYIGYKKINNVNNNDIITGFYIKFEQDYTSKSLVLEASIDNINYNKFYEKSSNINLVESGFIQGIPIIGQTGYKYFRFVFNTGQRGFDSASPTLCYSGWEQNTGSFFNQWRSLAMTRNGAIQMGVGNSYSGEGPYTGLLYSSINYGKTWTGRRVVTGNIIDEVKLNSIAIDKNFTGRFILVSRNGSDFNTGNYGDTAQNYQIYLSTNSGNSFTRTGLNGAWRSVAMSHNARVMMAVGDSDSLGSYAQISINSGITWSNVTSLFNSNCSSVTMNSNGSIIYIAQPYGYVYRSFNTGVNWERVEGLSNQFPTPDVRWESITTNLLGDKILVAGYDSNLWSQSKYVWLGSFYGDLWQPILVGTSTYRNASISENDQYQLLMGDNNSYISKNNGITWNELNFSADKNFYASAMSSGGKYQLIGGEFDDNNSSQLYSNCTFGENLPLPPTIRVSNANFYLLKNRNYFNYQLGDITGYGNTQFQISDFGEGVLFNPTGSAYLPAVSYETGLLTGLITDGGEFTWFNVPVSGVGSANNVFIDIITGVINSTGIINFNVNLLNNNDEIQINDTSFSYVTGSPISNYQFNDLGDLADILTSGATGEDLNLRETVGVSAYVKDILVTGAGSVSLNGVYRFGGIAEGKPLYTNVYNPVLEIYWDPGYNRWLFSDAYESYDTEYYPWQVGWDLLNGDAPPPTIIPQNLFLTSYYLSGEDGNNVKLERYVNNLDAIQIPDRYLKNGRTLRLRANTWDGLFTQTFNSLTAENSGNYIVNIEQEINSSDFSGIIFENNFYPNWSGNITEISQGSPFSPDLTKTLTPVTGFGLIQTVIDSGVPSVSDVAISNIGYQYSTGEPSILTAVFGNPNFGSKPNTDCSGLLQIYTGASGSNFWGLRQIIIGGYDNPAYGSSIPNSGIDFLGRSVDISNNGSTIIAGGGQGSVLNNGAMIFTGDPFNGWRLVQKISGDAIGLNVGGYFGRTVGISSEILSSNGGYVAIGRPSNNSITIYSGNRFPLIFSSVISGELYGIRSLHEFGSYISIVKESGVTATTPLMSVGTKIINVGGTITGFATVINGLGNLNRNYIIGNVLIGGYVGGYAGTIIKPSIGGYTNNIIIGVNGSIGGQEANYTILVGNIDSTSVTNFYKISGSNDDRLRSVAIEPGFCSKFGFNTANFSSLNLRAHVYDINNKIITPLQFSIFSGLKSYDMISLNGSYNFDSFSINFNNSDNMVISNNGIYSFNMISKLTGVFRVKDGLPYLGYSGLNIEFIKNYNTQFKNFANYEIQVDNKILFTGILEG